MLKCKNWATAAELRGTLKLQHALQTAHVSSFSRLNKQTCMPRNAMEIAKSSCGNINCLLHQIGSPSYITVCQCKSYMDLLHMSVSTYRGFLRQTEHKWMLRCRRLSCQIFVKPLLPSYWQAAEPKFLLSYSEFWLSCSLQVSCIGLHAFLVITPRWRSQRMG